MVIKLQSRVDRGPDHTPTTVFVEKVVFFLLRHRSFMMEIGSSTSCVSVRCFCVEIDQKGINTVSSIPWRDLNLVNNFGERDLIACCHLPYKNLKEKLIFKVYQRSAAVAFTAGCWVRSISFFYLLLHFWDHFGLGFSWLQAFLLHRSNMLPGPCL